MAAHSSRLFRHLVTALLAGLATPVLAIPGPELLPVAVPVVSPDAQQPDEIRVGQAADGRSVIAFISDDRLYVQRRAADGSAAGDATQILQDSGKQLSGLSLAVGANGHYTIGVQTVDAGVGRIFIRRYNPDGTRLLVAGEPDTGPLTVAFDGPPTCGSNGIAGQGQPAVAVDAAGNSAYTFTRVNYCPTGPGGALQPERTRLLYRYAPVDAPAADPVALFEQSPVTSAGFRVVDAVGSSVALQDDGNGLVAWVGHPEANQTPATYVRPVQFGLATAPEQRIDATNSFNRDAPVLGAKSNGYVLNWRGDFNDPQSGNRRQPCYVQARALDGSAQFAVQTVPGCGRNQIVLPDGRFELISSIGANLVGRRYDANGVETGSYGGGSRPNRFLDRIASAWSPRLANGNYLAIYNVDQADGSRATLEPVRYGGPDGTPQLNLEINPTGPLTISDGRTVSLFWTSNAPAGSCFGFGNLSGPLPSSGSRVLGSFTTAGTRSYGIACGTGELRKSVTLEIIDPDAVTATASWSPAVIVAGQTARVLYSSSNATRCEASLSGQFNQTPIVATAGELPVTFTEPGEQVFTLTCFGAGSASATATTTLSVAEAPPPVTVTASWSPASVFVNQTSTLTYSSENAEACTLTTVNGSGGTLTETVPISGSRVFGFTVADTVTVTVTCTGAGGGSGSASAMITAQARIPTVTASWSPASVFVNQTSTLTYSSENAEACTLTTVNGSGGTLTETVPISGSRVFGFTVADTVTATVTCTGAGGGTGSASATITAQARIPTVTASWSSASVFVNQTAMLIYSSENAEACTLTTVNGSGGTLTETVPISGSRVFGFTVADTVTATVTCTGAGGGTGSASATITALSRATVALANGAAVQITAPVGSIGNAAVVATSTTLPGGFLPLTEFIGFDVTGVPVGATVNVTLMFPEGINPTAYVKCTPSCAVYSQAAISGRVVTLTLTDGGAGDSDGVANGVIRDSGAPGTFTAPPPASGSGNGGGGAAGGLLPLFGLLLFGRRRIARTGQ